MYIITAMLPAVGKAYYTGTNEYGQPKWLTSGRIIQYETLGAALPDLNRLTEQALTDGIIGLGITIEELPQQEDKFSWKDTLGSAALIGVLMGIAGLVGAVETRRPDFTVALVLMVGILLFLTCRSAQAADGIEVPTKIIELSEEIGAEYGICPELLQVMAYKESSFNPAAANGTCIGLMQINKPYHLDRMDKLGVTDLYDSEQSMRMAADYLAELSEKYGDIGIALMVYNGFQNAEDYVLWTEELSDYAENVLELLAKLERAHGK